MGRESCGRTRSPPARPERVAQTRYTSTMIDERRRDSRARSGGAVRCESATGKELVSRWLDLGSGGLFVEADPPTAVGTLLTLEIEIPGERAAASATGRVTWIRKAPSTDGKPPGMGVTFIDIDDTVLASIGRFLAREAPSQARVQSRNAVVSRERTVLGVGLSAQTPAAPASPRIPVASREKTVLGVAPVTMSGRKGQPRQLDKEKSLHNVDDLPPWPDEPPTATMAAPPAGAPTTQSQRHDESFPVEKGPGEAEHRRPMDRVSGNEPAEPDVGASAAEKSVPIDLSVRRPAPALSPAAQQVYKTSAAGEPRIRTGQPGERSDLLPSSAPGEFREASLSPPRRRSIRRGVGAFVLLWLVLTLARGGYVYRARLWPWIARYPVLRTALARIAPTSTQAPGGSSLFCDPRRKRDREHSGAQSQHRRDTRYRWGCTRAALLRRRTFGRRRDAIAFAAISH